MGKIINKSELCAFRNKKILKNDKFNVLNNNDNMLNYNQSKKIGKIRNTIKLGLNWPKMCKN